MQEFFLQVDEEEAWIREREPQASSTDYGKDHSGVMALQQKHQALEAEMQGSVERFPNVHNGSIAIIFDSNSMKFTHIRTPADNVL